ncbi:hypothetical protein MMC27_003885 [Xylographa pallens]|nr:hypothetical protein [Xylographa pallens]
MPNLILATPPVTPAKKPAKPARVTRAVAFAAHLQPVAEADSAAETEAAKEASDTASASDTTNAEDSTGPCVDSQGGKQAAGPNNAASIKQAPATATKKPAATKLSAAPVSAAKKAPANKRATALKDSEASAQAESTEDEGPSKELEEAKKIALKGMPRPRGGKAAKVAKAARNPASEAMDIDPIEETEGIQQKQTQTPKQQRQPPASNRRGIQAKSTNPRGGGNKKLEFLYPNDFPSTIPLSETRFRGYEQTLPVVEYTEEGERKPFYIYESKQLREELLMDIPHVFHQEREHRLANEALELTREYVAALMYQEMNQASLIKQHMADDAIHKKNGVKFSAEEKKKRSDLLEDLHNPGRLARINHLHSKMKEMERGLEYFATEAEEVDRVTRLKEAEKKRKQKGQKGKGKVTETAEIDEEESGGEEIDEVESEADDEVEGEAEDEDEE